MIYTFVHLHYLHCSPSPTHPLLPLLASFAYLLVKPLTHHLKDYIHVLSRPMVIYGAKHNIWTTVYFDAAVG